MSLNDLQRLQEDLNQPRIVELHMALQRLRSCISFMNSGAHPDDECSAMLAALSFRDGFEVSYVCANRGEGGQNDLGIESGATLGAFRTAEMENAASVLDMRLYWLSTNPQDSIFDFGFSKSGEQTLDYWGRERTLNRFVSIVRNEQPDILCPTFLDVPGQHGHHRAMTSMAFKVMECAADANYRADSIRNKSVDTPWQISKLYLPAWGGGGSAYDDEVAPPAQTLSFNARDHDPVTGWSFENIGQQSRRFHSTQGMGRWVMQGSERDWPLHLAKSAVNTHPAGMPELSLSDGLMHDFSQWAQRTDDNKLSRLLNRLHAQLDATRQAFPDFESVTDAAFKAVDSIDQIDRHLDETAGAPIAMASEATHLNNEVLARKLTTKRRQLSRVIMIASGVRVRAWTDRTFWRPGDTGTITMDYRPPAISAVSCQVQVVESANDIHKTPWAINEQNMVLAEHALPSDPYPDSWKPLQPEGPVIELRLQRHVDVDVDVDANANANANANKTSNSMNSDMDNDNDNDNDNIELTTTIVHLPLETPPVVLSACSAQLQPQAVILNLAQASRSFEVSVGSRIPHESVARFSLPAGWSQQNDNGRITLQADNDTQAGLYKLPLELDGKAAVLEHVIAHAHIKPRVVCTPAVVQVRAMSVSLPNVRVGYIGGGNDRVAQWLQNIGLHVIEITDESLGDVRALRQTLDTIDTLVIGVFAYRMRKALPGRADSINQWVREGGHLLTLYHRPWDNWNPERIPPSYLEIGQPSLRFRVTDENASVEHLQPSHALLTTPNTIGPEDWRGWHKERGLYFAKSWADDYTPVLRMSDPDEKPHSGALLCADIGKGRHVHTSLILHHQMDHLVPGAFRLMANLVS